MSKFDNVEVSRFSLDVDDEPFLRLSVGLDLYFARPMDNFRAQVLGVWKRFVEICGPNTLKWARLGGGNKSREMNAAAYRTIESWLDGSRPYGVDCFINVQDGEWEQIGQRAFIVSGNNRKQNGDDDTDINYVQIRLPLDAAANPDELADNLRELAAPLDYVGGTGGLMLHATPFSRDDLWAEMKGLVTRYEGVEPDMAEDCECKAPFGLTGVNWLTFIGPPHLAKLGGRAAVETKLAEIKDVSSKRVGAGLMLRAGAKPRVGDRNTPSTDLDPYRAVYKLVKPAIVFNPVYEFSDDYFDGDAVVAWLQRFERGENTP